MSYKYSATQTVKIGFKTDEDTISKMVEDYRESDIYSAEWDYGEDSEYVLIITIYGNVHYYTSNSYYDPGEYDYDEQFVDETDMEQIKDCFVSDNMKDKVTYIWASEIEYN